MTGPRPAPGQPRSARRAAGFTLIEVVVAFVMLALVLSTSFQIFSTGLQRAGDLEDYSRALVIAQSQLAQSSIGDSFEEGQTSGETDDRRFRWSVAVAPFDDGTDPAKKALATFYTVKIAVRVVWQSASAPERHLDLSTLVVGKIA
ncbi:MAG: prepilin-type N-terminal cleavage/methylation domain-containing protein [Pseudomonadota bacterium]|nr:prepilin-type N-terminal cleavage/methylation domain-containing protein [Pseudomonadota bacterium]